MVPAWGEGRGVGGSRGLAPAGAVGDAVNRVVVARSSCTLRCADLFASSVRAPNQFLHMESRCDAIEALTHVSSSPARRRVRQTSSVHPWKRDTAWAQIKISATNEGVPLGGHDAVPRVSQPLRVEPPPEYNAPARAQRLRGISSTFNTEQVRHFCSQCCCFSSGDISC